MKLETHLKTNKIKLWLCHLGNIWIMSELNICQLLDLLELNTIDVDERIAEVAEIKASACTVMVHLVLFYLFLFSDYHSELKQ